MTDLCPTLLLIEDELPIRRVLCATLHANGYQVITAATAQEGCPQAAMCQPALILLDLELPDLDGLEVTRRLREWATMPIIVLSARGRESDKIAACVGLRTVAQVVKASSRPGLLRGRIAWLLGRSEGHPLWDRP